MWYEIFVVIRQEYDRGLAGERGDKHIKMQ